MVWQICVILIQIIYVKNLKNFILKFEEHFILWWNEKEFSQSWFLSTKGLRSSLNSSAEIVNSKQIIIRFEKLIVV